MKETELKYFIDTVTNYFRSVTGLDAQLGLPYVKNQDPVVMDYTGLIGISGPRRGGLYVTAGRELLERLTDYVLGIKNPTEADVLDMVGEMSNIIAGNAQRYYGNDYQISVPMVIQGKPLDISMRLKPPVFVLPITWCGLKAFLVVGME